MHMVVVFLKESSFQIMCWTKDYPVSTQVIEFGAHLCDRRDQTEGIDVRNMLNMGVKQTYGGASPTFEPRDLVILVALSFLLAGEDCPSVYYTNPKLHHPYSCRH